MTAYNSGKLIKRAITSVLNQTFSDFEVLVVNDGSQDNTIEVVRSIPDARIRLFDNPTNSGTYFSRNIGMLHAKGDYIAFVDSDDLVSPNRFKRILDYMDQHKNIMHVETHYVRFLEKSKKLWYDEWKRGVGFAVIRRQVRHDIGYFMPVIASGDMEYADRIKAFYGTEKSILLPDYTYWASKRADNLTSTIDVNGPRRRTFLNYAKKVFHPRGNLYVAFPYEENVLAEFSKMELYAGIVPGRAQYIKIIEPEGDKRLDLDIDQLRFLLQLSEECMEGFYAQFLDSEREWQSFFSKKRQQMKLLKLQHFTTESIKKMGAKISNLFS